MDLTNPVGIFFPYSAYKTQALDFASVNNGDNILFGIREGSYNFIARFTGFSTTMIYILKYRYGTPNLVTYTGGMTFSFGL